ncbi:glycoside hydrolase family 88 protein [Pyrenochaeta sp. MPI-SDFR-AT-0127]|nr:glycoside hydrolase family 88 protein [Pyrenochaeta sp. MPI-SDFR-AT-0127]
MAAVESPSRKRLRSEHVEDRKFVKESLPNLSDEDVDSKVGYESVSSANDAPSYLQEHKKALSQLYTRSVEAKIWGVAAKGLYMTVPPKFYPEYTKPDGASYVYRELDFWTSGFFPGSLYLLLERRRKYSHIIGYACKYWTENLHKNARLHTTHDLGFMIMPWAKLAVELNHDLRALETIKSAANTLFGRFSKKMGCMRSWDTCKTKNYHFDDMNKDFMVIIDNMMNLNLLFYAASKTSNRDMFSAAVQHAQTTARTHIRADGSTIHVVVFDTQTGGIKHRITNQGYAHTSCWARGQSWAIAGFAETYSWTHDKDFLDTARRCADYFLARMPKSGIVPWDFDALEAEGPTQPPDSSAALIAAYGMLLIHRASKSLGQSSSYLAEALKIIEVVCTNQMNSPTKFVTSRQVVDTVEHGTMEELALQVDLEAGETILNGATINNYEFAPRRWANHGLVYADYFFLLTGNLLMEMGIGQLALNGN